MNRAGAPVFWGMRTSLIRMSPARRHVTRPLASLVCAALVWLAAADASASPPLFEQPPPFEIAATAQAPAFRYPEDLSRPTIVVFWATWCPYCKALMPHLQSLLEEFPGEVDVVALTIREDGDPAGFLAEYGYDFRLVEDADSAAESWGVKGTPGLFLADADGRIVFDRMRVTPPASRPAAPAKGLKHYQRAARGAPFWAARLRQSLDGLLN